MDRNADRLKRPHWVKVALRKESVDRNSKMWVKIILQGMVALRKESVDRNTMNSSLKNTNVRVALRKESVDRNPLFIPVGTYKIRSLSARRAWIEMPIGSNARIG